MGRKEIVREEKSVLAQHKKIKTYDIEHSSKGNMLDAL